MIGRWRCQSGLRLRRLSYSAKFPGAALRNHAGYAIWAAALVACGSVHSPSRPFAAESDSDDSAPGSGLTLVAKLSERPSELPDLPLLACLANDRFRQVPEWADSCDGSLETTWSGVIDVGGGSANWSRGALPGSDPSWPCDQDGRFIPRPGLSE